jgi:hypothetical protein
VRLLALFDLDGTLFLTPDSLYALPGALENLAR